MKKLTLIILLTLSSFISYSETPLIEKPSYEKIVQDYELYTYDYYINGVHIRICIMFYNDGAIGYWVYINGENVLREVIE